MRSATQVPSFACMVNKYGQVLARQSDGAQADASSEISTPERDERSRTLSESSTSGGAPPSPQSNDAAAEKYELFYSKPENCPLFPATACFRKFKLGSETHPVCTILYFNKAANGYPPYIIYCTKNRQSAQWSSPRCSWITTFFLDDQMNLPFNGNRSRSNGNGRAFLFWVTEGTKHFLVIIRRMLDKDDIHNNRAVRFRVINLATNTRTDYLDLSETNAPFVTPESIRDRTPFVDHFRTDAFAAGIEEPEILKTNGFQNQPADFFDEKSEDDIADSRQLVSRKSEGFYFFVQRIVDSGKVSCIIKLDFPDWNYERPPVDSFEDILNSNNPVIKESFSFQSDSEKPAFDSTKSTGGVDDQDLFSFELEVPVSADVAVSSDSRIITANKFDYAGPSRMQTFKSLMSDKGYRGPQHYGMVHNIHILSNLQTAQRLVAIFDNEA